MRVNVETVKEQISQHIRHPYLVQHIQKPVIDDEKLLILLAMLNQQKATIEQIEKFALTTMLVQIALDTHEIVSNEQFDEKEYHLQKERQLTVLGGIYYSSLYYKILAEMGNINLTRKLSIGIKEVNEHKVIVYRQNAENVEQLMFSIKKIETALFESVCNYFASNEWKEIMQNILFVKRLTDEKTSLMEKKPTPFLENLNKIVFPNENILLHELTYKQEQQIDNICNNYINKANESLFKVLKKIPNIHTGVLKKLIAINDQHSNKGKTIVGEW